MTARFRISDETVHAAFDSLSDMVEPAAAASVMKMRCDDARRRAKAEAFMDASGTIAEKEAKSVLDRRYVDACERFYEAYEADEYFRNQRNKADAIIRGWQSCQANMRSMSQLV